MITATSRVDRCYHWAKPQHKVSSTSRNLHGLATKDIYSQPPNHYYGIVKRRGEGLKTSSFFFVKRVAAAQSKLCIKTARKSQKAGSYIITLPLTPSPSHSQIYQHILNV